MKPFSVRLTRKSPITFFSFSPTKTKYRHGPHTDWISPEKLILEIKGLNLDTVWDNFIIQVGDLKLGRSKTLAEQIEQDNFKAKLTKDIEKLEKKARKEKQPNKKFELAQQVNTLKKKLGMRS